MFVNNIDPILFRIFGLEIRYYGIIYAFGFLFTVWYLLYLSRKKVLGLDENEVYDFSIYLILGVLVGARVFEVLFYQSSYYFSNPKQIIAYWNGGLSFHGGLVGAIIATWLYLKFHNKKITKMDKNEIKHEKHKIGFYDIADALVVPAALGLALGRIANFINGELYGKITTVFWAVKFKSAEGFRHPTQIYESIKNFIIFAFLFSWQQKALKTSKHYKKGYFFWVFVTMYGAMRFIIEFWKEPETMYFGIPVGQIFSLWMFVIGAYVLLKEYKMNR